MYKINVENDFENLTKIIEKKEQIELYDKIYYQSNEHVKEILSNFDLNNKDILTVLGSGDQALNFLNNRVKNVDTFDINRLSIYYFYLRIWIIKYFNRFYPEVFGKISWDKLKKMIVITSIEERKIHRFWDLYFERYDKLNSIIEPDPCLFSNEITNLDTLKKELKNIKIKFYNIDIASNEINLNKKYDIIYASNISDWLFDAYPDNDNYINYKNNLKKLLKKHGMIICAYAYHFCRDEYEAEIFSKDFDSYRLDKIYVNNDYVSPGYYYIKK